MSSLRYGLRCLRDLRATATRQPSLSAPIKACTRSETRRTFTTTTVRQDDAFGRLEAAIARNPDAAQLDVAHVRPMPLSPSYFSRHTQFNDSFVLVQDLARKYGRLPFLPPGQAPRVAWKTKEQYRLAVGEAVKARDYAACIALAKRLNQIHPDLMPEEVQQGLRPFKRDINFYLNRAKPIPIDRFGRSHGVGRRKSSVARAWLVQGTGEVLVNGKTLNDAFGRVHDRESALWGLKVMDRMDKYNVWALVEGGGTTGQAEALAMAVSKALAVHEPALKTPLKKAGCLTRDPRKVERKKAGHVKARKMPAWVKR
ncbi:37S ribosomal protein S9 [Daldinia vernicosa]|uniref:37S ribosomal protein S9 n=1 Tax=Daldinia vernicosa TaxID=114800 RepID=UPI002007F695|nr:37S ribosomal protein S9 [Daldinia vernicosa]KAI0849911.1 37S ribosomal protein S9 [Daldinia vernicosa]